MTKKQINVNARIKEILDQKGLTQVELAERLGMNRVSVSRLLNPQNDMRTTTLEKLASAIGCDVADFFKKEESHAIIICPECGKRIRITASLDDGCSPLSDK